MHLSAKKNLFWEKKERRKMHLWDKYFFYRKEIINKATIDKSILPNN